MKNIRFCLATIVFTLLAGLSNTAAAKPVCPSQNFNQFLKRFESDITVQKAFIKQPLKYASYAPSYADKPNVSYLQISEVDYPVLINARERKKQGVVLNISKKSKNWYQVSTHSMGTGAYTFELNFKRNTQCWQLVELTDLST